MFLCENGELKLSSRPMGEELFLDFLLEKSRAGGSLSLRLQKSRRHWGIGLGGESRVWDLRKRNRKNIFLKSFSSHFPFPGLASSLCFNLDTEQPTTFLMESAGFGYSVVQYANSW